MPHGRVRQLVAQCERAWKECCGDGSRRRFEIRGRHEGEEGEKGGKGVEDSAGCL